MEVHWVKDKNPEKNGEYLAVLDTDLKNGIKRSDSYVYHDGEWYFSSEDLMKGEPVKDSKVVAWMEFPYFDICEDCSYFECLDKLKLKTCPQYDLAKFKKGDIVVTGKDKAIIKKVCASQNGLMYRIWYYNEETEDYDPESEVGINERHLTLYTPKKRWT